MCDVVGFFFGFGVFLLVGLVFGFVGAFCLFVGVFFLNFESGCFCKMGFAAHIWSYTGHGEGRLGVWGGGVRQEQTQKSFSWLYFVRLGECKGSLGSQKSRGRARGFGAVKFTPGKQVGTLGIKIPP